MSLVTDKPQDIPTGNALDNVPDDLLAVPPAYLTFGSTPSAMEDPPGQGDIRTFIVRTRCKEEHGPIERKDGEMRYTRTMQILLCVEAGKKPNDTQPALFDHDGDINPDAASDTPDERDDETDPDGAETDEDYDGAGDVEDPEDDEAADETDDED